MALGSIFIAIGILVGSLLAMSQMIGSKKEGSQVDPSSTESEDSESESSTPAPSPESQQKSSRWWKFAAIFLIVVVTVQVWQMYAPHKEYWAEKRVSQEPAQIDKTWRLVGNFPVDISSITFNKRAGKNGELPSSGEVIIPHTIHVKWEYRITLLGAYERRFQENWYTVGWQGMSGTDPDLPFPTIAPGALVIRIGRNAGFFPSNENGEMKYIPLRNSLLYARLNIKELQTEYIDSSGGKIRNSTLSIKIERRMI